jgi:hypothetical protein
MVDEGAMSEDRPDPERTVIVEEAHLLHDQIEFSEEEYENADNDIEEAYHQTRVKETQKLATKIESDGLSESRVRGMKSEADEQAREFDEETPESARVIAKLETAEQVLEEYFGDQRGPVELGDIVASSVYEGGTVELNGLKNSAMLTVSDEANARATADAILGGADLSIEDERRAEVF